MTLNVDSIPACLRDVAQWVRWRYARGTKLPYQVNGELARSNDPETWTTFSEAIASLTDEDAGVGFMFSAEDEFCGIDLDGCRSKDGTVAEWAKKIVYEIGSYAELSPSGTGVKIWIRGQWKFAKHKAMLDEKPVCDRKPSIEVYDALRYFAVTGQRLRGYSEIKERQAELDALGKKHFADEPVAVSVRWDEQSAIVERCRKYVAKMPAAVSGSGGHNATFYVACIAVCEFGLDHNEAMSVLREYNQRCQPMWTERELEHKAKSAASKPKPLRLRTALPRQYERIEIKPHVEPPMPTGPRETTLEAAALAYLDMVRAGGSQFISTGVPDLDYALAGGVLQGEMVILAGRPNHGKSAIALQAVHDWTMNGIPAAFISEEMSALSLGKRSILFASSVSEENWVRNIDDVEAQARQHFEQRKPCIVVEQCGTAEAACEAIRRLAGQGVKAIVLDYAQLLISPGRSRNEQVSATSQALRRVTNETQVLLITLCQLNREIEKRNNFVPCSSDLRDSGQLEQDADAVIFGVWPHRVKPDCDPNLYQFFVSKNRNRDINQRAVQCRFEPGRQRFLDEAASYKSPFNY